ncbi:MAG: amidohydrolase family protein [Planctomycetota bacterium]|nr:amidohydrolase family protein [Planctomycetota bacterium]
MSESPGRREKPRLVLRGARAVLPDGATDGAVSVVCEGGRIRRIERQLDVQAGPRDPGAEIVDVDGRWILPGLVDLQVNDIAWLARGLQDPAAHAGRIREVLKHQVGRGVTGVVLATLAAPVEEVLAYLVGMKHVLDETEGPADAAFLGGLVEGTFMNPECPGAHNPKWVLRPDRALLDRFLATTAMRLVNIAPEMAEDAVDLVRYATDRGVVVGCGHAKPHGERLREAVEAGLRYIIHLGNGPTGSNLKGFHDGGMLEESLRNDRLVVTLILDGYHIHPRLLRDWIARKEVSRVVGVSDAGFATGPPDGEFEVFGIRGRLSENREFLHVVRPPGSPAPNPLSSDRVALFGSAIDQLGVLEFTLNLLSREMDGVHTRRHAAWPFARALEAAVAMTSTNPSRLLGLDDRGRLEPDARADFLVARIDGTPGAYRVRVERTFLGGKTGTVTV